MQPVFATVPAIAVSAIFCVWNTYRLAMHKRNQMLRQRVAHMLWVAASDM